MADGSSELPSLANLPWWDLLRDEQLQQLIRTALAENRDLQRAVATVEEFRARALVAKMDYVPGITVSASMGWPESELPLSRFCEPIQLLLVW